MTLTILTETGKLLWLVLCLGLVFFNWFWHGSIHLGARFKTWIDGLDEPKSTRLWSDAGQFLLETGQNSVALALTQARQQLGLPVVEASPPPASTPQKPPAPSTAQTPPPQTVPDTAAVPANLRAATTEEPTAAADITPEEA